MEKSWFWYPVMRGSNPPIYRQQMGFLSVDESTGDLQVTPEDDHYCGVVPAADAVLLAHEILDRQLSLRPVLQTLVSNWALATFGEKVFYDVQERCMRFGEEAIELIQATEKVSREDMHKLVDYVYDRPVGTADQELGGVMVTLNVLATSLSLSTEEELKDELHRILDPEVTKKIQAKQHEKEAAGVGKTWNPKSLK